MRKLVSDSSFTVETCKLNAGARIALPRQNADHWNNQWPAPVRDRAEIVPLFAGQFCLIPASLNSPEVQAQEPVTFLRVEAGAN